ncbi:MAG TPA: hypothetical protein VLG27_02815 [Candidatus Saccharimonadia bacterium]|nr:hypothetical protein [Candidatus Saccharimonadia bacterium]
MSFENAPGGPAPADQPPAYEQHYQPKTYEEFLKEAREALSVAVECEARDGLEAAAPHYKTAYAKFSGAIGEGTESGIEPNPEFFIEFGAIEAKEVESGQVEEYDRTNPLMRPRVHSVDMGIHARNNLLRGGELLVADPETDDKKRFLASVVIAAELDTLGDVYDAQEAVKRARLLNHDPKIASLLDGSPSEGVSRAHQLSGPALLDLANGTHEALGLAA